MQYTLCCYSYDRYDGEVTFVCGYEAGCLGYSLYHQLKEHAVDCKILAPSTAF